MTEVTGWRCWDLGGDVLRSPMIGTKWAAGPMRATCVQGRGHTAPDPDCQCGWKAAAELRDLLHMLCVDAHGQPKDLSRFRERPPAYYPPYVPEAFGRVTLSGRILGPARDYDRDGTIRAACATVKGPLFFGQPFARAAQAAADRYHADVVVSDLPQPDWIRRAFASGTGLAADIRLYWASPAQLGGRLHKPAARAREIPR